MSQNPPQPPPAQRPDPRSRGQRPQDPYGTGSYDPAGYGAGAAAVPGTPGVAGPAGPLPGAAGQNRYGLGAYDSGSYGSGGAGATGSYDSGSYDTGGGQRRAARPGPGGPGASGGYPAADPRGADPYAADPRAADPYAADPYATGGFSASAPRRPQTVQQPAQPPRTPPGRAPYGAAPQAARGAYRDPYDTGAADAAGYEAGPAASGAYETGQFDRRAPQGPGYDRPQRGAQGYGAAYEAQQPYDQDGYERDPYREEQRPAGRSRRRAAAEPELPDPDEFSRDDFDEEPPGRSRRRGARRDEPDEDFQFIDEDEDDDGGSGGGRPGRRPKQPKRGRNCLAVLVAFAVLAGGLGFGGFKAYKWYHGRNAQPADYTATSNADLIDVVIPTGAGGTQIGQILFNADVIKSQGSFINACTANSQCSQIQANTYLLPKEISAAAAVNLLLNPSTVDSKGQLNTYGGERAAQIFKMLETKKGWTAAAITTAMNSGQIDLPAWDTAKAGANFPYAPIEGFIAAEQYDLSSYATPQALLKKMVDDQLALLTTANFPTKAQLLGVSEYQLLIIASMAQAEAANTNDLPNIAEVVFNRLKDKADFFHLGFDTVTLYGLGNTVTVPTAADLKDTTNPYNTHEIDGLPPGPIGNPDTNALAAAASPAQNNNTYFCAISPTTTVYASSNAGWAAIGKQYPKQCGGG